MTDAARPATAPTETTREIVVEELLPHAPEVVWRTLTTGALIGRWMMAPEGFVAEPGARFSFRTTPEGAWDGTIRCEVLEVEPCRRLSYAWKGGHPDNRGYGAPLDTLVSFTLVPVEAGTRLRLVHSGFRLPLNETAFANMGKGWKTVIPRIGAVSDEEEPR